MRLFIYLLLFDYLMRMHCSETKYGILKSDSSKKNIWQNPPFKRNNLEEETI